MKYHTKNSTDKAAGYGIQLTGFFEHGQIGKYKPDVSLKLRGPYETGAKGRCIVRVGERFLLLSVPELKSLWVRAGHALGVDDRQVERALHSVPYDKRITD